MLLKDGRIGLIDFGQVKRMTIPQRITYAKLILAHARNDTNEIVRLHFDEMGASTKFRKHDIAYKMSAFYNDRDTKDVLGEGYNIATFIDYLQAQDPIITLPEDYIFASRVNLILRGMGKAFGLSIRMSKMWEKEAQAFLDKYDRNISTSTSSSKNEKN